MIIEELFGTPIEWNPNPIKLWEENMHELWSDYKGATMFIVRDENDGCSAVYFNGTSWVNAGISVNAVTNGVLAPNSMIRITYLGPLS